LQNDRGKSRLWYPETRGFYPVAKINT